MNSVREIEQRVRELASDLLRSEGLELVQVQYRRESAGWVLRVLIDRTGGVTVENCTAVSRELSDVLDVEDLIPNAYSLEVSSPGLDRPLIKREDFQRFAGREISLSTAEPVEGRRRFRGRLVQLDGENLVLEVDKQTCTVRLSLVEKANLVPEL